MILPSRVCPHFLQVREEIGGGDRKGIKTKMLRKVNREEKICEIVKYSVEAESRMVACGL